MDRIEELETQVRNLSLAIRICLAVIIVASAAHCSIVLVRTHDYFEIYGSIFAGNSLPTATELFLSSHAQIMAVVIAASFIAVILLFSFRRKIWALAVQTLARSYERTLTLFTGSDGGSSGSGC